MGRLDLDMVSDTTGNFPWGYFVSIEDTTGIQGVHQKKPLFDSQPANGTVDFPWRVSPNTIC